MHYEKKEQKMFNKRQRKKIKFSCDRLTEFYEIYARNYSSQANIPNSSQVFLRNANEIYKTSLTFKPVNTFDFLQMKNPAHIIQDSSL